MDSNCGTFAELLLLLTLVVVDNVTEINILSSFSDHEKANLENIRNTGWSIIILDLINSEILSGTHKKYLCYVPQIVCTIQILTLQF